MRNTKTKEDLLKELSELQSEHDERLRLDKLKDEFISVVSHEMRTPLTIIKGAVSNLKDGIAGELSEIQKKVIETTDRNVDRLSRIINDLLDLSRLESGKSKMRRKQSPLDPLLQEVLQNFQNDFADHQIAVSLDTAEDLPLVYIDSDMVMQVFTNLIHNAIRFAQSKIAISVKAGSQEVTISIEDDGIGIAKEDQKGLFSKFQQINRPSGGSGYKGTGLGLSICREIVSHHQGKIWVHSTPNKGACFCFTLPVYQKQNELLAMLEELILQNSERGFALIGIALDATELATADILNEVSVQIRKKALRNTDLIYFDEETQCFFVILPDTPRDKAVEVVKRVASVAEQAIVPHKVVSFLCGYPEDAQKAHELIGLCEKNLKNSL